MNFVQQYIQRLVCVQCTYSFLNLFSTEPKYEMSNPLLRSLILNQSIKNITTIPSPACTHSTDLCSIFFVLFCLSVLFCRM